MTLLELSADLKETNRLLARIADAIEFAAGMKPVVRPEPVKKTGLEDISRITNEGILKAEIEREMKERNPGRGGVAVQE